MRCAVPQGVSRLFTTPLTTYMVTLIIQAFTRGVHLIIPVGTKSMNAISACLLCRVVGLHLQIDLTTLNVFVVIQPGVIYQAHLIF